MIKKTIEYTDYNGHNRTEDFYFNLSKAEILEMELSTEGGLEEMGRKLIENDDLMNSIKIFKNLILKSYGIKSEDGKRFIKSEELAREFSQTEAYSNLFTELATDTDAAAAFFNGVIPSDLEKAISDQNDMKNKKSK
jgi:hypothetical protein